MDSIEDWIRLQNIIKKATGRIYRTLPKTWRASLDRRRASGRSILVTVVIPVYNVEAYLAECLDSILAQTHQNLDVVVVDDGSPDRSIDIARQYAARDRRVRIVRQQNAGLGAARNTGVAHARGKMLCFVDSDDSIPPEAVEAMVRSLVLSGSDFAVGSLLRETSAGRHMPNWAKQLHATTRRGMTFADDPGVLKNVFAWTKLYRTEYFRRVVRSFPDGLYEDQIPAARAYLHGTFDILRDVVCYWRIRDDGTSITQQKSTMKDLVGRWSMLDELAEEMKDAPPDLLRSWQVKTAGFDMRPYYEQVPRTPDEYWEYLRNRVRHFVDQIGYDLLAEIAVADRLMAAATYHGFRDDVTEIVQRRESQTWKVPGKVVDGRPVVAAEYFDGLQLEPDDVITSLDVDVEVQARVDSIEIDGRRMVLSGSALLANIGVSDADAVTIRLSAVGADGGRVAADLWSRTDAAVDSFAKDPWNDHAGAGFVAHVDLAALESRSYSFEVEVEVGGVRRSALLDRPDPRGRGRFPVFGPLDETGRWCVERQPETATLVVRRLTANRVPARHVVIEGSTVRCDLVLTGEEGGVVQAVSDGVVVVGRVARTEGQHRAIFDLSEYRGQDRTWVFSYTPPTKGARSVRFSWEAGSAEAGFGRGDLGLLSASQYGNVVLESHPLAVEIQEISMAGDGLQVVGWSCMPVAEHRLTATLSWPGGVGQSVAVDADGQHGFRVVLPLRDAHGTPLPTGRTFALDLTSAGNSCSVRLGRELRGDLLSELEGTGVRAELRAASAPAGFAVLLRAPFAPDARGRRHQRGLQVAYAARTGALQDTALFEAFNGRSVGDSPLALSRELHAAAPDTAQFWSVVDLRTPVPEWATPVLRFSGEWYEHLATARLLVNNNNWPWFFAKRPGQRYVQTWHGTPLKRIGNDVPDANLSITYRRLMEREARTWDVLLAQNDYSAEIFPRAFGYAGPVLVEGYPRNDALVGPAAQDTRAAVRRRLGIEDSEQVLLYAPTWRDNIKAGSTYGRVSFLDAEALPQSTVVLYRGHANTAGGTSTLPDRVIDVTHHADVNELMLAADVLVTDYSSIMFDFAVLQRPIYFLVPDLAQYSEATRGFYRPLADVAPGPLCKDTAELCVALESDYWATYDAAHQKFRTEFAPLDDGQASRRVLARLAALDQQETP